MTRKDLFTISPLHWGERLCYNELDFEESERICVKRGTKRLLTLAVTAVLTVQPVLGAMVPEGYKSPFSDVRQGDWYYPFVASLNSRTIISGYPDGRFGPNDPTRLGDSLIMILRAAQIGTQQAETGSHYASQYGNYAVARGWLTQEQNAALDGPVSRLVTAQVAAKALGLKPSERATPFADVDDPYVTALYDAGVISGSVEGDKTVFKPQSSLTRAEMSVIVWQIRERTGYITFRDEVLPVHPSVPANCWLAEGFAMEDGRASYEAGGVEARLGVDVSHMQGRIDWEEVANDGVEFAIIRAGGRGYGVETGTLYEDTRFRENLKGAQKAGLQVGTYFFSQATSIQEAEEEARFLLDLLDGAPLGGPVVFDWENIDHDTARTDNVDTKTLTAAAQAFCQIIEQAGYQPMIYLNQYMAYLRYDLAQVCGYPFWLAQYSEQPDFPYEFWMWQYTDQGEVDGIRGNVDLNLFFAPPEVG